MKKILFLALTLACAFQGFALERGDTTVATTTLDDIIKMESKSKNNLDYELSLQDVWSKTMFLNISYNKTKFSSDEFPSTAGGFNAEYKNDFGLGLQMGRTFNFHKKPLGSVLFIGLDFTWLDVNINKYAKEAAPAAYSPGGQVHNMPWHNEKMSFGYGMSVGPSLTFYPFTPLKNTGSNKIRLQLYYHIGYGVEATRIKEVLDKTENTIGHGLFMAFGGNLTWDFIGVGCEMRSDNSLNYKNISKEFDTGKMKAKEKAMRIYLQFRF